MGIVSLAGYNICITKYGLIWAFGGEMNTSREHIYMIKHDNHSFDNLSRNLVLLGYSFYFTRFHIKQRNRGYQLILTYAAYNEGCSVKVPTYHFFPC